MNMALPSLHTRKIIPKIIPTLLAAVVCLVIIGGSLLLPMPRWSAVVDVGNEGSFIAEGETRDFRNFLVFHASEQWGGRTFRWSEERGTVTIPAALRMSPLLLEIVACGCRPDGRMPPTQLLLNGDPLATFAAPTQWRRYRMLVPHSLTYPGGGLTVDLRTATWTDTSNRSLGLAVDRIALHQREPSPLADPLSAGVVLAGLAVLVWRRRNVPALPLLLLLLTIGWLVVNVAYQPQWLPRPVLAAVFAGGLVGLWLAHSLPSTPLSPIPYTLCTLLALWLVFCPHLLGSWIIDDSFVSFRYADNLASGNGLVFNIGERVEGYTNFLWTVLVAGMMAMGGEPIVATSAVNMVLGFVIVALTMRLAYHLDNEVLGAGETPGSASVSLACGQDGPPPRTPNPEPCFPALVIAPVAAVLLAVSSPFLLYSVRGSGMETALFTALILATLLALAGRAWVVAGLLTVLTMMTRPDGIILAGCGTLYALLTGGQGRGERGEGAGGRGERMGRWLITRHLSLVTGIRYGGVVAALYIPYFLWRWSYYGYLLPNTFYAKVGSTWSQIERGAVYLFDTGNTYVLPYVVIAAGVAGIWAWHKNTHARWPLVGLIGGMAALFALYVVIVGGDWMPGARFVVPIVPLLVLLIAWGEAGLMRRAGWGLSLVLLTTLLAVLVVRIPRDSRYNPDTPFWEENYWIHANRETGLWLNTHTPTDTLIATAVAGAIPFYSKRPTIDALGLTDEYIAHRPAETLGQGRAGHEKTDPDYILKRNPHIITFRGSVMFWEHPLFSRYHLETFHGREGRSVKLFIREDMMLSGDASE
jgi:arabinofuranosyltransferase